MKQAQQAPCPVPSVPGLPFTGEGEVRKGVAVLFSVNIIWALLPMYWTQLTHVPAFEVLCHRSFWGFLLIAALLWSRGRLSEVRDIVRNRRSLKFMAGCSISQMFGWGFYIWAVGSGHILDAALGHYVLPMLSVLCGFLLFRERPRRMQWLAIATAAAGVLGMVVWYGALPWVGLLVACNGVLFAAIRKRAPVNAVPGLCLELLISAPILWSYLVYLLISGNSAFMTVSLTQDLWLFGAGIVTIIPQIGYAYGLCRVPLTTISLLQYLPPTGNVLVGVILLGETFTQDKMFGFSLIWTGLVIFSLEAYRFHQVSLKVLRGRRQEE
ncbi:MAG: EamA family transporter RarD [Deltaproteobacteria bacterium]|nr:EamA family transporter RarD [Deltaproteobacteria bacterium]